MDEKELTAWLDALAEQGLIEQWHCTLYVAPRQPAEVIYLIDARRYTHDGAVRLVRDFEAQPFSVEVKLFSLRRSRLESVREYWDKAARQSDRTRYTRAFRYYR